MKKMLHEKCQMTLLAVLVVLHEQCFFSLQILISNETVDHYSDWPTYTLSAHLYKQHV